MARFVVNSLDDTKKDVEAQQFEERGSFLVFDNDQGQQVFAIPTDRVLSVERAAD